jgi:hypothetical protein
VFGGTGREEKVEWYERDGEEENKEGNKRVEGEESRGERRDFKGHGWLPWRSR